MLDYPKDNWLVIHLNVEDLKSPDEFFINLVDAINEHQPEYLKETLAATWDFLRGVFSTIESIEAFELKVALRKSDDLKKNWHERASQLMDRILGSNERVLFIIDELPDMLNAILKNSAEESETFLHWFRKLRDKSLSADVRWLVGGSVNLIASLDQQGKVKLINDLKVEPLSPFNEKEVTEFVTEMFNNREVLFDDSVAPRIWELLGYPIPLFLQMLTQELYRKWKRNRAETISADTVTEVFNKALLGEMARDKLQHYRARIDIHYPLEEREATIYLLNKLSIDDNDISKNTLFNLYREVENTKTLSRKGPVLSQAFQRLLLYLQSDFYVEEINGRIDFSSRLLKTWWRKYYGYEYGDN
ncbi:MAG: hypothetical protein KAJ10_13685 [Thermodesulfovibrionia bacterium]|nr:hypothetical protein [Thermodesulfovibrionia bacterium]